MTTFNRATSLERILAEQLVQRRVTTDVISGFAAAALALAALGMYGLLALLVSSRRREMPFGETEDADCIAGCALASLSRVGTKTDDTRAESLRELRAAL